MTTSKNARAEQQAFALAHGIDPEGRTIYLVGGVDDQMAARLIIALRLLDAVPGPIRIVLISAGGSEAAGFAIYDAILVAQNLVTIDCFGAVQSIAAMILQAGGRRRMSPECRLMFHHGALEIDGRMDQRTVRAVAQECQYLTDRYCDILASRSNHPLALINQWCNDERYFSAQEAIAAGLADELITQGTLELPQPKTKKEPQAEVLIDASALQRAFKRKKPRK